MKEATRMRVSSVSLSLNLRDSLTHIQSSEFYSLMNIGKQIQAFRRTTRKSDSSKHRQDKFRNRNEEGYVSRNIEHIPGIVF
jgi:hypothetical protein